MGDGLLEQRSTHVPEARLCLLHRSLADRASRASYLTPIRSFGFTRINPGSRQRGDRDLTSLAAQVHLASNRAAAARRWGASRQLNPLCPSLGCLRAAGTGHWGWRRRRGLIESQRQHGDSERPEYGPLRNRGERRVDEPRVGLRVWLAQGGELELRGTSAFAGEGLTYVVSRGGSPQVRVQRLS